MSRQIIKFGTWNNNPIEWTVLKEDNFQRLVISRYWIERRRFTVSSSYNSWITSELRNYLNKDFYEKAFTVEETRKIVNTKLSDVGNAKDNIFVLSEQEMKALLTDDKDYESSYYNNKCSNCTWTRTPNGNGVSVGFTSRCAFCSRWSDNSSYCVRPAMYLKK